MLKDSHSSCCLQVVIGGRDITSEFSIVNLDNCVQVSALVRRLILTPLSSNPLEHQVQLPEPPPSLGQSRWPRFLIISTFDIPRNRRDKWWWWCTTCASVKKQTCIRHLHNNNIDCQPRCCRPYADCSGDNAERVKIISHTDRQKYTTIAEMRLPVQ